MRKCVSRFLLGDRPTPGTAKHHNHHPQTDTNRPAVRGQHSEENEPQRPKTALRDYSSGRTRRCPVNQRPPRQRTHIGNETTLHFIRCSASEGSRNTRPGTRRITQDDSSFATARTTAALEANWRRMTSTSSLTENGDQKVLCRGKISWPDSNRECSFPLNSAAKTSFRLI